MPGSIPYTHPSLVLGHVADTGVVKKLQQMVRLQRATDGAKEKLDALVRMKRSLSMTLIELEGMGVERKEMESKLQETDAGISSAANEYMRVYLQNEATMTALRDELAADADERGSSLESPIDFEGSVLKNLPLRTESLKLDSQYFSMEGHLQADVMAGIEAFVREAAGEGGGEMAKEVSAQVANQNRHHHLCGTLIIVANCTHRNVGMFSPLVIDPDKAIRAWNRIHEKSRRIERPGQEAPGKDDDDPEDGLTLITGAAYASSFVGMMHVLQAETEQTDNFDKLKEQLEQKLRRGGWLSHASGGVGVDPAILEEVKGFLSTQSVATHISVLTMGVVPSLKAGTLKMGVKKLAEVDGDRLKQLLDPPRHDGGTMASDSDQACGMQRALYARNLRMSSLMTTMADIDGKDNRTWDMNSLMTALDNYIDYVNEGKGLCGAPVHFYTRTLTRSEILRLWREKYDPKEDEAAGVS